MYAEYVWTMHAPTLAFPHSNIIIIIIIIYIIVYSHGKKTTESEVSTYVQTTSILLWSF